MAFIDNGDGTITVNGFKIAKPFGMRAPAAPAAPGAWSLDPTRMNAANGSTLNALPMAAPNQPEPAPTPPPQVAALPPPGGRRTQAEAALEFAQQQRLQRQRGVMGGGAADIVGQALDPSYQPQFQPAPPKKSDAEEPSDRAAPMADDGLTGLRSYAPPRVIDPGGMRTVAETTQKGVPIPQDLREQREGATMSARAANQVRFEAEEEEAKRAAIEARAFADEQERRVAEDTVRAERHRDTMVRAQQNLERSMADYRSNPINEDAYWQEKGRGAKMLSGIWVAMGQLAQRMGGQGTENVAKTVVDRQIDDWIADKKERRAMDIQGQQTALANVRQNFESERAQEAALRAQAYDAYRARLQAIAGENAPPKLRAQALALDADLQQKGADWGIQAAQAEADHVTTQSRLAPPTVVGGAPAGDDVDIETYVHEAGGFATRKDAPPKMTEQFVGLNKLDNLLAQAERLGDTLDKRADPSVRAQLQSVQGQIDLAIKQADQLGALDKGAQEVAGKITGNPSSLLGIGRKEVLGNLRSNVQMSKRNLQNTYGITPGYIDIVPDAKGGRKRVGIFTGQHGGAGRPQQPYDFRPAGR